MEYVLFLVMLGTNSPTTEINYRAYSNLDTCVRVAQRSVEFLQDVPGESREIIWFCEAKSKVNTRLAEVNKGMQ